MAFCTKCGKELVDGQACTCQTNYANNASVNAQNVQSGTAQNMQVASAQNVQPGNVQNPQTAPAQNVQPGAAQGVQQTASQMLSSENMTAVKEKSMAFAGNAWGILLNVLKNPVTAGRQFVASANTTMMYAFIIMQAVLTGIFGVVCVAKLNGQLDKLANEWGISGEEFDKLIKLPVPKAFLISALGSVVVSFIIVLAVMGLVTVFKGKTTFANVVGIVSVRSIGISPVIVVAIVVTLIKASFGITVFALSAFIGLIFMHGVLTVNTSVSEDKVNYITSILVIAVIIVYAFMVSKVTPMYFTTEFRVELEKLAEEIEDADGFFNYMLEEMFY